MSLRFKGANLIPPSTCAAPSACGRRPAARTKGSARMPRWRQIDVSILDEKAARKRQAVPA